MLGVYGSLVPPLLPFLPSCPNFIMDWSGATSRGKTTMLRIAASVWGQPAETQGGLVRSWDSTRVWIERAAAVMSGAAPLILDDTKRSKHGTVAQVLYDIASGVGRGRGTIDGTRAVSRWRTVLLSTGETPATSLSQDGGTRARVLSMWGSPWGETSEETARVVSRVSMGILEHYGHLGPQMIGILLKPGAREVLQSEYRRYLSHWTNLAGANPVLNRCSAYVAALCVARDLAHGPCGIPSLPVGCDPIGLAWQSAQDGAKEADRAAEALRYVFSWATGQQGRFDSRGTLDTTTEKDPPQGWLGACSWGESWQRLAILPHELRGVIEKGGYDAEACLQTWWDRGWLDGDAERHMGRVRVGNRPKTRCYVIVRASADAVLGADEVAS
jgi:hypothetical protein